MLYFVKNPDNNACINTIHQFVLEGRLDAEIAELLNNKGVKNLQASGRWTEAQVEQTRWNFRLDSEAPVTIGEHIFKKEQKKNKRGIFWTLLAAIVTLIYLSLVYSLAFAEGMVGGKLIVYLFTALMAPLVVVGLFQIFSRFRNKRPKLILWFWVVLIMILTSAHKIITPILPIVEETQLPDITKYLDPVTSNVSKYQAILEVKIQEGIATAKRLYEEQKASAQTPSEQTPEPVSQPPVEETTEKASQPPVEEATEKASQPPVEETPEPVSQPPVEETPEPVSQPPVEETPEPVSQPPVEETPEPVSQPPVENTPEPVSQPPVENTPEPVSQPPVEDTPEQTPASTT